MGKYVRAIKLPNGSIVLITLIARTGNNDDGINLVGHNGRSVGFIEMPDCDPEVFEALREKTSDILNAIINETKKATQPDWSYLKEVQAPAPAVSAVQPTRSAKKVDSTSETKNG